MIIAILCGSLFGAGVVISDMVNPGRVKAFLEISSDWDPTLGFVMAGALAVKACAWLVAGNLKKPAFATTFDFVARADITPSLIAGSMIFGAGWGLVGFCPGPAVAAVLFDPLAAGTFIGAMLAGMLLRKLFVSRLKVATNPSPPV